MIRQMIRPRRRALVAAAAILGLHAVPGAAQEYPTHEVRLIVPQAPGGASDALARLIGLKLTERWGQTVVVENRPGANGNIGTQAVSRAPADGYTLLLTYGGAYSTSPALYSKLPWAPQDFAAVAPIASLPFVMVVNSKLPVQNLSEFIEFARSRSETLNNASPGNGSINHLLGELFSRSSGVKMTHVAYQGISQALTDLIAGRVDVTFSSAESVSRHVAAGTLRPLAVTSAKRSEMLPSVPTMAELGIKDIDVAPWFGILAPAGTPADRIDKINRDVAAAIATPEIRERFKTLGANALTMSPREFDSQIRDDLARWRQVVQAANIKLD